MHQEIPEIDPESPEPPTVAQVTKFLDSLRPNHQQAAASRGLEGEVLSAIGIMIIDDKAPQVATVDGPPTSKNHTLYRSTWERGGRLAAKSERGDWTVQNNLLIELWNGQLWVNVVTLIRPNPEVEGSHLPEPVIGFGDIEPSELVGSEVDPEQVKDLHDQGLAKYLIECASDWGSWHPLPWSEFSDGLGHIGWRVSAIQSLKRLEELGLVKIEMAGDTPIQIHYLPAFVNIFLRPAA